ncbi:AGCS family amino acid carrier protein [Gammaproteobacteria bacterium]|nr:AGCS family amino acid carrier protein [Gammaproteobacteria bacterium]MDB2444238.1 AGCS family amino acid carrier protein [Gammaproteobacteria bacterium]
MDAVNDFLIFVDGYLGSAIWFPALLLSTGVFFTLYLRFPQVRYFRHAISITTGRFDKSDADGDTTHFQALATALSGTVGTGNIGGVALALHLGGPAALFWMWVTAFFGMTSKFVEVTLSHKYREKTPDGSMAGGPMYYMEKGLNAKWLAILFALATVLSSFGTGSLPQINSIAAGLKSTFDIEPIVTACVLSVLLGLVILGGIKRIARFAAAVVPSMAVIYLIGAFAVILPNLENIIPSFVSVFSDAFSGSAATGGFLGATFAYAFDRGVNRGLYSNEAGQGSAPIAHAAAKTDEATDEGMVSILEPFIDTICICTITGLVILSSGVWNEKFDNQFQRADMIFVAGAYDQSDQDDVNSISGMLNGAATSARGYSGKISLIEGVVQNKEDFTLINSRSFAEDIRFSNNGENLSADVIVTDGRLDDSGIVVTGKSLIHSVPLTTVAFTRGFFGDFGQYIVAVGLMLFAFSTAIAWSYYGDRAMTYLFGPKSVTPYRVVYVIAFFYAALADTTVVWNLALITIVLMTAPNLIGILVMHKEMRKTVSDYWFRKS